MPPVAAAVAAYAASFTLSQFIIGTLVSMATSFVLGGLQKLLTSKPSSGGVPEGGTTSQVKQPITSRKPIYGEMRVSGPILAAFTSSTSNKYLHYIIALAPDESEAVGEVWLNDYPITDDMLDADGMVNTGRYNGKVRIRKYLGTQDQEADALLSVEVPDWTTDHRLQGVTYIYVRLQYSTAQFPTGIPNISAFVKGRKLYDPRTLTTAYSTNMALIVNDYIMDSDYGLGATTGEIDQTFLTASANICDEFVTTTDIAVNITSVDTATDLITLDGEHLELQTGDRVQATTTGTLPAGLSLLTNYYVFTYQRKTTSRIYLASSYANALAGVSVDITDAGSGTHTVTKIAEPRYSGAIQIDSDSAIVDSINNLLTGMSGKLSYSGGSYRIIAGAYSTPTVYFDENDFAGAITVQTKISRRERFNSVHGLYLSPLNDGQPADYPPVTNTLYQSQDQDEEIIKQINYPATPRPHTAQRLAKIDLEKGRQEITFSADFNLAGMLVQAGDSAYFSVARFGWTEKIFEISDWKLDVRDLDGVPLPVVNMTLRETASGVWDWNNGEETVVDLAPNANLPDPFTVAVPGSPQVSESLFAARDGGGVKSQAVLTSAPSEDSFVVQYQFRYKLLTDTDYTTRAIVSDSTDTIFDIPPGVYSFEARAINILGVQSAWIANSPVEIIGLSAPPADPTGLTIQAISSFSLLRWDQSPDLDVTEGGKIVFRHSPALDGSADWSTSVSIGDALPGRATDTTLPLKAGTYLMRFYDSSGNPSGVVQVITTAATVALYTPVTSITENATFTGVKVGIVLDTTFTPDIIRLTGAGFFDDIPDFDAVSDLDYFGGLTTSGTYDYHTYIDLITPQACRLESHVKARIVAVLDQFDDRTSNIDDWTSFDGVNDGNGDCTIWVAATDDDPSGAPTWSDWQRLDVGEYDNRAYKFQARLMTSDPIYNVLVEELSISVKQ